MNKLRLAVLCLGVAVLAACASSGTGGNPGSNSTSRSSGNEAAIANMNLGAGYLRQGNTTLAIERLQRALQQDPRLAQAHATIALAYDQIGELDRAGMHYLRATELEPRNGVTANFYAVFLCNRQNRWAEAEPYFRRAAEDPNYPTPEAAFTNAGVCARDAGQIEVAATNFRAALARNATFPDALLNMMQLSYEERDFLQARAFVQRYLSAQQATASVLLLCVNVERELDNSEGAQRCASQLRTGFQGSPELAQLEEQQRRDGR